MRLTEKECAQRLRDLEAMPPEFRGRLLAEEAWLAGLRAGRLDGRRQVIAELEQCLEVAEEQEGGGA